ncbi:pyridoxamine 5'-phosphate oxidase family protein [Nocardioides sp.]|uniref:pyridoxamine 5'-phosphate oxidase family protein n=1 Tax=Nocardioides sp. TaxID=35761 RepID=UPI0027214AE5|nr:TIGR03618 family F420-dependent PPOX class oxidoreductase [Nocardioides sp.]MDO9457311.1 TIGR03618 family F420-dependent PPOX class oxidoreductase [Nocardioides sp.]
MTSWTPGWGAFPEPLLEFWTERHLCSLTTLRPDGRPHLVPVGVALDHERECAWVITGGGSRKVQNLLAAGAEGGLVAAGAVDGARWSTLEGVGVVVHDPESVARAVERYAARYRTPRVNPERVAIRISVTRFVGSAGLF